MLFDISKYDGDLIGIEIGENKNWRTGSKWTRVMNQA